MCLQKLNIRFSFPGKMFYSPRPGAEVLFFVEDPMRKEVSSGRCAVPQQDTEEEVEGNKV